MSKPDSAIMEFKLYCDDEYKFRVVESLPYIGSFLGFFVFSWIADNKGRKIGLGISWLLTSIGIFVFGMANSYWMLALGSFIGGFGVNPAITIHYSFINEHSSKYIFIIVFFFLFFVIFKIFWVFIYY